MSIAQFTAFISPHYSEVLKFLITFYSYLFLAEILPLSVRWLLCKNELSNDFKITMIQPLGKFLPQNYPPLLGKIRAEKLKEEKKKWNCGKEKKSDILGGRRLLLNK